MAKNLMTPEQDILTREFYQQVASDAALFPSNPVIHKKLIGTCLMLLNYDYMNGCYVAKGMEHKRSMFGKAELECEWSEDTRRAMEALNGDSNSSGEDETDSSEPTEDSEVRETILREDV